MPVQSEVGKKGLLPKKAAPPTIDDVYLRVKEIIGELKEDPHKVLREMRDARG
ncbi:conserved protein of unknown function [Thermococcus camini]|uniref:Uncharacterized protein n=2 Tax=Thermococcus camini TaxID=2016373 RepID=A0A7G2D9D9_9EURY|nr:conserved protein of unknown function [Thermococcus camini]